MRTPITPNEVKAAHVEKIPDVIFDAFNDLIAKNYDGSKAIVRLDEAVEFIVAVTGYDREDIFTNHYLDIEDAYRDAGWLVYYNQSAYTETIDAKWEFTT